MNDDAIPLIDPLVLEAEESAIVSETDALHSSDDEGNNLNKNWLSSNHTTRHQNNTEPENNEDDSENDSVDENEMKESAGPEDFYCSNMDDEDEAYVYKHLRSGKEETVHVRRAPHHQQQHQNTERQENDTKAINGPSRGSSGQHTNQYSNNNSLDSMLDGNGGDSEANEENLSTKQATTQSADPLDKIRLLKPRNSDAILSCPRCFNVVCMDCQQHERYSNQYRAMFVMNIGVDWSRKMMYDDAIGALKPYSSTRGNGDVMAEEGEDASMPDKIPHDDAMQSSNDEANSSNEAAYYSVHCSYCSLELAALDLKDEIYYFFGCIASS